MKIVYFYQCWGSGSAGSAFLGLPDPDPLVRGTDPDTAPAPDRILPFSHRCVDFERTEIMPAK